jgi:hypothetical protein
MEARPRWQRADARARWTAGSFIGSGRIPTFIELLGTNHALLALAETPAFDQFSRRRLHREAGLLETKALDRNLMSPERLAVIFIIVVVIVAMFVVFWGLFIAPS